MKISKQLCFLFTVIILSHCLKVHLQETTNSYPESP